MLGNLPFLYSDCAYRREHLLTHSSGHSDVCPLENIRAHAGYGRRVSNGPQSQIQQFTYSFWLIGRLYLLAFKFLPINIPEKRMFFNVTFTFRSTTQTLTWVFGHQLQDRKKKKKVGFSEGQKRKWEIYNGKNLNGFLLLAFIPARISQASFFHRKSHNTTHCSPFPERFLVVNSNQSLDVALNFEMPHGPFWFMNEFYAITAVFSEDSFNIFKLPFPTLRKLSLTKAMAIFLQILFAFLSKALVKMTKQKRKY